MFTINTGNTIDEPSTTAYSLNRLNDSTDYPTTTVHDQSSDTFYLDNNTNNNAQFINIQGDKPVVKQPFYNFSPYNIKHDIVFHPIVEEAHTIRIAPSLQYKALGTFEGNVNVVQNTTGNTIFSLRDKENPWDTISSFVWRPSVSDKTTNVLAGCYTSNTVIHWLATTGKKLTQIKIEEACPITIDYFPDGERFAVGCDDGSVRVYNDVKRAKAYDFDVLRKHSNSVLAVKCYDDFVLSSAWDNNLKIWDPRSTEIVHNINVSCPFKDALDFDGNYIVTGSLETDSHVKVFDIRTFKKVFETTLYSQTVLDKSFRNTDFGCKIHALSFCKFDKSKLICSTVHNNTLKLISFKGGACKELFSYETLPSKIMSVDTCEKNDTIHFSGVKVHGE